LANTVSKYPSQIVYFESEGRDGNLQQVIRVIKKFLKKRDELRPLKLVIFTARGEGPMIAYKELMAYSPKIVAVTFPLDFSIKDPESEDRYFPRIPEQVKKFFVGVGISVVSPAPLPLDSIEGLEAHNQETKMVKETIALFGGGFTNCVQAVLRACDAGELAQGERVIAMSGDCAAVMTASMSKKFLTPEGLSIHEILCKPRNLTIARPKQSPWPPVAQEVLPPENPQKSLSEKNK
jgi:hypothetical protein